MAFKITTNPGQMGGVPCLRGLRIPVATVALSSLGVEHDGDIPRAYPISMPTMFEALFSPLKPFGSAFFLSPPVE